MHAKRKSMELFLAGITYGWFDQNFTLDILLKMYVCNYN